MGHLELEINIDLSTAIEKYIRQCCNNSISCIQYMTTSGDYNVTVNYGRHGDEAI